MIATDDAVVIRKLDLDLLLGEDGAETSAVTRLYPGAMAVAPLRKELLISELVRLNKHLWSIGCCLQVAVTRPIAKQRAIQV